MALDRHDALKMLNVVTAHLAPIALKNIDLEVAMISVWGLYTDRLSAACVLCADRGVPLSEDELSELGKFWVQIWDVGVKDHASQCPLCRAELPANSDKLCACINAKRIGRYIEYAVPGAIKEIARAKPGVWRSLIAEAFACQTCERIFDVTLGQIADRYNQGKPWRTLQFCRKCSQEHFQKIAQKPQDSPPEVQEVLLPAES